MDVTEIVSDEGFAVEGGTEHEGGLVQSDKWREIILKAHPEVVPEMIKGETLDELLDSVEPARAAFASVIERLASQERRVGAAQSVPAGGMRAPQIDVDKLPPSEMLRRGVSRGRS
jgi:hypothetical protein